MSGSHYSCFQGDINMISSILVSFNESFFLLTIALNVLVPSFLFEKNKIIENTYCKSVIYKANNIGPRADP